MGAQFVHGKSAGPPPEPPAALVSAAEAERRLIADLDATTGGAADARRAIVAARADHAAHLAALTSVLSHFRPPSTTVSRIPGVPRTRAQLRVAEQQAATAAAAHASALAAGPAALLASIAACEATHAELLR